MIIFSTLLSLTACLQVFRQQVVTTQLKANIIIRINTNWHKPSQSSSLILVMLCFRSDVSSLSCTVVIIIYVQSCFFLLSVSGPLHCLHSIKGWQVVHYISDEQRSNQCGYIQSELCGYFICTFKQVIFFFLCCCWSLLRRLIYFPPLWPNQIV